MVVYGEASRELEIVSQRRIDAGQACEPDKILRLVNAATWSYHFGNINGRARRPASNDGIR